MLKPLGIVARSIGGVLRPGEDGQGSRVSRWPPRQGEGAGMGEEQWPGPGDGEKAPGETVLPPPAPTGPPHAPQAGEASGAPPTNIAAAAAGKGGVVSPPISCLALLTYLPPSLSFPVCKMKGRLSRGSSAGAGC